MGKVIPFPMARARRPNRRQVDVFADYFELLRRLEVWDRILVIAIAVVTLCAMV
jgi:hypothetical protein